MSNIYWDVMKYAEVHLPRMRLRMSELHMREEGKAEKILLDTKG